MANIWQQTINWTPTIQQQEQFQRLYEFILEGNSQLNLTRITAPQEFWEKHLWDSLRGIAFLLKAQEQEDKEKGESAGSRERERIFPHSLIPSLPHSLLPTPHSPSFIDIGTGAGFPGIPVAIALGASRTRLIALGNSTMTLLDSTRKKIAFIDKIRDALALTNVKTLTGRSEEIGQLPQHRQTYDVALIRAVGTATVCAEYVLPLLKEGGLAVIYRGHWTEDETKALENAVKQLGGAIESIEEFTTPLSHSIRHCLYLRKIGNTPSQFPRAVGIPTQKPL